MTAADRLTAAADTLDALADAATPGPWEAYGGHVAAPADGCTCHGGDTGYGHEPGCGQEPILSGVAPDASLSALTSDPATVRLIAALLRDEGEWHATGMALDCPSDQFLALADHINRKDES